mgnify:CR=1 FL=1
MYWFSCLPYEEVVLEVEDVCHKSGNKSFCKLLKSDVDEVDDDENDVPNGDMFLGENFVISIEFVIWEISVVILV